MALKCLASYKVGNSYWFVLPELGKVLCYVTAKGDKKLELSTAVDTAKGYEKKELGWFSSDQISLPTSKKVEAQNKTIELAKATVKEVKTVDVKKFIGNVAKVVTGNLKAKPLSKLVEYNPDKDQLNYQKENLNEKQDSDNIDDHQYALRNVMRDLRWMLRHIGVECDKDELISETLAKVKANLKVRK